MKPFKDWYAERKGPWPGVPGERHDVIFARLCDAVAEYVDEFAASREPLEITGVDISRLEDASDEP